MNDWKSVVKRERSPRKIGTWSLIGWTRPSVRGRAVGPIKWVGGGLHSILIIIFLAISFFEYLFIYFMHASTP